MSDSPPLTHLNARGEAHIVDIADKAPTRRRAVARARLEATPETLAAIMGGTLKKGDALAVARIAGIMAAKKTAELIPLCHPIALTRVEVQISSDQISPDQISPESTSLLIVATAETTDRTGVEMEALTAASVAALTLYDMAKAMERGMRITGVELVEKSGGKSGDFRRDEGASA
jgi:cyclic pyranopterin phosphate synthase